MTTANRLTLGGYVRLAIISTMLWLTALPANSDELSGREVQIIMQQMSPMFSTLTVCISGKCSAAYECGQPPNMVKRPDGTIRVFTDCEEFPDFVCINGEKLNKTGDWCRFGYPNGSYFKVTLEGDGFSIEDTR